MPKESLKQYAKEYLDAEQHFLSAMDIDPNFIDSMIELAKMKLDMNEVECAQKYYKMARSISANIKHPDLDKII